MRNRLGVRVWGLQELQHAVERAERDFRTITQKALKKMAYGVAGVAKKEYLTDPGRIYGRWRTRNGLRYREVIAYGPERVDGKPKIGVLTGRLRQSVGARTRDGVMVLRNLTAEVGTNVEYARFVVARRYDFMSKALADFEDSTTMGIILEDLSRQIEERLA